MAINQPTGWDEYFIILRLFNLHILYCFFTRKVLLFSFIFPDSPGNQCFVLFFVVFSFCLFFYFEDQKINFRSDGVSCVQIDAFMVGAAQRSDWPSGADHMIECNRLENLSGTQLRQFTHRQAQKHRKLRDSPSKEKWRIFF